MGTRRDPKCAAVEGAARPKRKVPDRDGASKAGPQTDVVELDSIDSFPASDPPSWTPVTGTGAGKAAEQK